MLGTIPTATDSDMAGEQLRLDPEGLIAKFYTWGPLGVFPNHQWNVSGSGKTTVNTCQHQWFLRLFYRAAVGARDPRRL